MKYNTMKKPQSTNRKKPRKYFYFQGLSIPDADTQRAPRVRGQVPEPSIYN